MSTEAKHNETTPDVVNNQIRLKLEQVTDVLLNYILDFAKVENETVDHCFKLLVLFNTITYHNEATSILVRDTTRSLLHYFKVNSVKAKAAMKNADFAALTAMFA